jgi:hypothetical protein
MIFTFLIQYYDIKKDFYDNSISIVSKPMSRTVKWNGCCQANKDKHNSHYPRHTAME